MIICPSSNVPDGMNGNNIGEFCPSPASPVLYFTELVLNGNLIIPPQKPPKEHIVKVTHSVNITDVEVIQVGSPNGTVGYKILVTGTITLNIQYSAAVPDQKVHFVHYDIPFNAIIVEDCGGFIPTDPTGTFVPHVCVEKIRLTQIDSRTLNKEIVLMVWAEARP